MSSELGDSIRQAARDIADLVLSHGFEPDASASALLLNSLITAQKSRRRIYLNAFQRSGEILHHFGHRLHRLDYEVHTLDPWSIIAYPQPQDVIITLSGSLETEPVLVTLLHADREGLYRFVLTAQPAEQTRQRFQGVLPLHIPGHAPDAHGEGDAFQFLLPLGSLFELRSFLFLEAVMESLTDTWEKTGATSRDSLADTDGAPSPVFMGMLKGVREAVATIPELMRQLLDQFRQALDRVPPEPLGRFLLLLEEVTKGDHTTYVTGYGRSNEVGGLFAHRLANLGAQVALTPTRLERPSEPGDLLLAITGHGSTYEVLQRMSGARRGGLRTAALTATQRAPVSEFADLTVVVPAVLPPRYTAHQKQGASPAAPRPSQSTFGLNMLLVLEATLAVLMRRLGKEERDLNRTQAWQGY